MSHFAFLGHWRRALLGAAIVIHALASLPALAQDTAPLHAIGLGDRPKYPADFPHLDYVNPDAPKGGELHQAAIGSFDSLNPFIIRGDAISPPGLYETLTTSTDDDALSEYGLIAQSMEVAPDNSWIVFNLRPEARWHDGQPITAEDVVFSFEILRDKGSPTFRFYYADVEKAEALSPARVKFSFKTANNRELPVIMGQLTVLPKHYWEKRAFDEPSLDPPLGSGPYRVKEVEAGRRIVMERVADYWGARLPINIGTNNYDRISIDFYRDPTVLLEAFKSGAFDIRSENSAKAWATAYESPALADGRIKQELLPDDNPEGMQGFVFNLRRPVFQDRRVRQAFILAFDFEWSNKNLFFGQYTRTRSFFQNSEMEAKGLPDAAELALLEPYRNLLPAEVFTTEYNPPISDGSGENEANLAAAAALLEESGWKLENGKRVKNGAVLSFEFLIQAGDSVERIIQPYLKSLERLGIQGKIRAVDSAQYQSLIVDKKDFDMFVGNFGRTLSPGNEQRGYWGSEAADAPGSANYTGLKDPAIDALIEKIVTAPDRASLITVSRAFDRALQWQYLVVPNFHLSKIRLAYWDKFGRPEHGPSPAYGTGSGAWWIDPAKEAALHQGAGNAAPVATAANAPNPSAETPNADRGRSPIVILLYVLGFLAAIGIAYALGRRRKG